MNKENEWYRKLLIYSLLIGIVGGISALAFTIITNTGTGLLFGDLPTENWSGSIYWIPLTAFGVLLITYIRKRLSIPKNVPGAVELAQSAWVDPSTAPKLILIAVLSIVFGASLGPSYGIVVLGGAFGSWLAKKIGANYSKEEQKEFARTGMTGGLGSVFGAPILATILSVELSPSKKPYIMSVLPRLVSSSLGYIIFFGVTGAVIINAYTLPEYTYRNIDLALGALLGVFAVIFLLLFTIISKATTRLINAFSNDYIKAIIGGAGVGFIAYAVPLSFGSGNSQLASVTTDYATFSIGVLFAILIGKTVALRLSQDSGFVGGVVFPMLFFSGVAGVLISAIFPSIPVALSVGAMMAAIPGAALTAPISLILIAVGSLGQSSSIVPPITIAVVVTQVCMFILNSRKNAATNKLA